MTTPTHRRRCEHDACGVCGHAEPDVAPQSTIEGLYQGCRRCGSETRVDVGNADIGAWFAKQQQENFGEASNYESPVLELIGRRQAAHRAAIVDDLVPRRARILEVGPGSGHFLREIATKGHVAEAIEASPHMAALTRARVPDATIFEVELEHHDPDGDRYDAIVSFHVIEHVIDASSHLDAMVRLAKPGGVVLVATPSTASLDHRILRRRSRNYSPAHLRLFSPSGLRDVFVRSGLGAVKTRTNQLEHEVLASVSASLRRSQSAAPRGARAASADEGAGARVLAVTRWATAPVRAAQARLGFGNELMAWGYAARS